MSVFEDGDDMRTVLVGALCVWALVCTAQNLDPQSGNYFLPGCRTFIETLPNTTLDQANRAGQCLGIVKALLRLGEDLSITPFRNCSPNSVTSGEAVRAVVTFLEARPQRLHENFIDLAAEAIAKAWPCRE
jgi:Rap1a immunity proteins